MGLADRDVLRFEWPERPGAARTAPRGALAEGPGGAREALAGAPWLEAALDVALDGIVGSAYIVGPRGRVVHANSTGRALLRSDRASTEARIAASSKRFRITLPRRAGYEMVVLEPALGEAYARAEAVGVEAGLSGRESEVLGLLASGLSNKQIASELGCVEKTVEGHVSRILAKTGCTTRNSLVAGFWTRTLGWS